MEEFEKKANKPRYTRLWISLVISALAAIGMFIWGIRSDSADLLAVILTSVFTLTFVCSLFYFDGAVISVILWMGERSIGFPGLIWEFSIDGFIWMIGMKILFAVIGFFFGVVCAILGVIIGYIISPFAIGFAIHDYITDQKEEAKDNAIADL